MGGIVEKAGSAGSGLRVVSLFFRVAAEKKVALRTRTGVNCHSP